MFWISSSNVLKKIFHDFVGILHFRGKKVSRFTRGLGFRRLLPDLHIDLFASFGEEKLSCGEDQLIQKLWWSATFYQVKAWHQLIIFFPYSSWDDDASTIIKILIVLLHLMILYNLVITRFCTMSELNFLYQIHVCCVLTVWCFYFKFFPIVSEMSFVFLRDVLNKKCLPFKVKKGLWDPSPQCMYYTKLVWMSEHSKFSHLF